MKRWPTFFAGGALVLVVIALVIPGSDDSGKTKHASSTPAGTTEEALGEAVSDEVDDANQKVSCTKTRCEITYDDEALGAILSPQEEFFEHQRPAWKAAFDDGLQSVEITVRGEVTSVGGKSSTDPVMRIACSRKADKQIDWDQVQLDGIKQLCNYQELVKF